MIRSVGVVYSISAAWAVRSILPFTLLTATTLAGLFAPLPGQALGREDHRVELTPEEVLCNREQLAALAERTSAVGPGGGVPTRVQAVFLNYSNRYGFYDGMVVGLPQPRRIVEHPLGPSGPEYTLGFHLNPSVRELLRNPERTPLEQISLTREISTSTLVRPGDPFEILVRLDPTLGSRTGGGPTDLQIDNLETSPADRPGFRPADTKPGRGLSEAALTEVCHTRLTDLDLRVFSILQRTLRPELYDPERDLRYDTRIVLYRREEPDMYEAQIRVVDPETGALVPGFVSVSVQASSGDGGSLLGSGRLVAGNLVEASLVGRVRLIRPLFAGVEGEVEVVAEFDPNFPILPAPVRFDWRDVLAGTAWNDAPDRTSECGQGNPAELAATPRGHPDLELLALQMAGGLTADQAVYDRLVRDLLAIRALEPAVAEASFLPATDGKSLLLVADSLATYRAIEQGEYDEWACLNDWYGLEAVRTEALEPETHPWVDLRLEGIYGLRHIAPEYAALPGILRAEPISIDYPPVLMSSLCAAIAPDGVTYRYFFDVLTESSTFLTYFFTTDPEGSVDPVGVYNPNVLAPPPVWLPLAEECYEELRG